jgi:acetyltransferase
MAKGGDEVTIRPIRPEDEPLMVDFHQRLSQRSVYSRYFHMVSLSQRTAHVQLTRMCFIDYDRTMALLAEREDPKHEREFLGIGWLTRIHGTNDADAAVLVKDDFQRQGLGTELLQRLIHIGRQEKIERIAADILAENRAMQLICQRLVSSFSTIPSKAP